MLVVKQRRRKDPTHVAAPTESGRRIMKALREAMEDIRDQVRRQEGIILDGLLHQPIDRIVDLIPVDPWFTAQEKIEAELLGDYLDGGSRVRLRPIRKEVLEFAFDRSRPEAAEWARKESAQLVTNVTEEQRRVIRSYIGESLDQGVAPRDTARGLRNVVGLTEAQSGWVQNHYDRQVQSGLSRGLTQARAEELAQRSTDRYHSRVFRYRTETIARTETLRASHAGRQAAWQQGLQGGWISPGAGKQWSTNVDDRSCDICVPLDQMVVPIGGLFPDGEPPIHPNCRCDILLVDRASQDLEGLSDAEIDDMIDDIIERGIRPGMGDRIAVGDADYQEMLSMSGKDYITGRAADGSPIFNAQRQQLHDRIIGDLLDELPRSESPTMSMLGGGPASGKSTMEAKVVAGARATAVKIDPDDIKGRLPEYNRMLEAGDDGAAAFVHEESSYLAKRVAQAAAERRIDIVYDGTGNGDPSSLLGKINVARGNGYTVRGYYVTIPTDEAVLRATKRAERTGRKVPEEKIRFTHKKVSQIWETAAEAFDEIELYDNSGDAIRLIAQGSGGTVRVLDEQAFAEFLAKAVE